MSYETRLQDIAREMLEAGVPRVDAMETFERALILAAMEKSPRNKSMAAARLGVCRNTLMNRLRVLFDWQSGEAPRNCGYCNTRLVRRTGEPCKVWDARKFCTIACRDAQREHDRFKRGLTGVLAR